MLCQWIAYQQDDEFSQPHERLQVFAEAQTIQMESVLIEPLGGSIRVTYRDCANAMPDRGWWTAKSFDVGLNQWVQIAYNGRYSSQFHFPNDESVIWWYEKSVVNVGRFLRPSSDVFTRSTPSERYALLGRLI